MEDLCANTAPILSRPLSLSTVLSPPRPALQRMVEPPTQPLLEGGGQLRHPQLLSCLLLPC